jgi:nicotinamidase-related amidase
MIPRTESAIGETPALIVIDAQQGSPDQEDAMNCDAASIKGGWSAVIENINTLVRHARDADIPIVWGKELHRPDFADYGAEFESSEPVHGIHGTVAENLDSKLDVDESELPPAEYEIIKRRYNFFHRTDLEHLLKTYGINTVILAGFMTNICVHYTAHGAHEHDYAFRTVEECTAAPTQDLHDTGLKCMRYLQPRGVRSLSAVTSALNEYEGNSIVQQVKETGSVATETGPIRFDVEEKTPGTPEPDSLE